MFMLVFIRDLGSSLMFFAAFLALLYVATGRFSFVVIGMAMFTVGAWFFASTVPHVQQRVDIWLDPWKTAQTSGLPGRPVALRPGRRRPLRQGLRAGAAHDPRQPAALLPAPQTDTIYALIVNELGLFGACAVILIYVLIAAARLQDRAARRRRLLEAAGDRPDRGLRAAGLRDHRRRHPGDPADRRHPALHQLRRQLDRRQLRPAGAAAADLRPRPPPRRRPPAMELPA